MVEASWAMNPKLDEQFHRPPLTVQAKVEQKGPKVSIWKAELKAPIESAVLVPPAETEYPEELSVTVAKTRKKTYDVTFDLTAELKGSSSGNLQWTVTRENGEQPKLEISKRYPQKPTITFQEEGDYLITLTYTETKPVKDASGHKTDKTFTYTDELRIHIRYKPAPLRVWGWGGIDRGRIAKKIDPGTVIQLQQKKNWITEDKYNARLWELLEQGDWYFGETPLVRDQLYTVYENDGKLTLETPANASEKAVAEIKVGKLLSFVDVDVVRVWALDRRGSLDAKDLDLPLTLRVHNEETNQEEQWNYTVRLLKEHDKLLHVEPVTAEEWRELKGKLKGDLEVLKDQDQPPVYYTKDAGGTDQLALMADPDVRDPYRTMLFKCWITKGAEPDPVKLRNNEPGTLVTGTGNLAVEGYQFIGNYCYIMVQAKTGSQKGEPVSLKVTLRDETRKELTGVSEEIFCFERPRITVMVRDTADRPLHEKFSNTVGLKGTVPEQILVLETREEHPLLLADGSAVGGVKWSLESADGVQVQFALVGTDKYDTSLQAAVGKTAQVKLENASPNDQVKLRAVSTLLMEHPSDSDDAHVTIFFEA